MSQQGHKAVIVQTIGFLCDHVEILYDIDISFREFARGLGMRLERTESLNGSPILTEALADLSHQALDRLAERLATNPQPSRRGQLMPRIAIIGGGLSGVSTAYELARRGHTDFVLYEATSRLGGIVETHRQDGFVIECGADSWVTEKPWARELAIELGLEDEIIPSNDAHRRTYLLEDGKLIPMPDGMRMMVPTDLEAIATSPLFSESARQAYREEPSRAEELKAFAASRPSDWDESVASFVQRHFGSEVAEKIAGPLLAGVFGGDIRKLSAQAVMANFVKMEREHGSLILGLQRHSRNEQEPALSSLRSRAVFRA